MSRPTTLFHSAALFFSLFIILAHIASTHAMPATHDPALTPPNLQSTGQDQPTPAAAQPTSSSNTVISTSTSSSSSISTSTSTSVSTSITTSASTTTKSTSSSQSTDTSTTPTTKSESSTSESTTSSSTSDSSSSSTSTRAINTPPASTSAKSTTTPVSTSATRTNLVVSPSPFIQNPGTSNQASISSDVSPSSAAAANNSGFLHNTGAMAGTFTVVGLIGVAAIFGLVAFMKRKRRQERELEETDFVEPNFRPNRATYATSSFGVTERYQPADESYNHSASSQPYEEDVENTLAVGEMQHAPFDPYQNSYALPTITITPDEYRLSILEQYEQPSPIQGPPQMQPYYGTVHSTVPLSNVQYPAYPPHNNNFYATPGQYMQNSYPGQAQVEPAQELHLHRQRSTRAGEHQEFGFAC